MYCIFSDQGDGVCLVKRLLSAIGILFFLLNCIPSIGFFKSTESIHRTVNFNREMVWFLWIRYNLIFFDRLNTFDKYSLIELISLFLRTHNVHVSIAPSAHWIWVMTLNISKSMVNSHLSGFTHSKHKKISWPDVIKASFFTLTNAILLLRDQLMN